MSCLSAVDSQVVTLLSVPHEILFLQHKVFREYAKIAVGPDFVHTVPSFLVLASVAIVLWRNPPSCNGLAQAMASTMLYKAVQLVVSWIVAIAVLWLWLTLQRLLYCCVWYTWSYESEYRQVSYQWWQRVWSSYYSPALKPPVMSASFISWLISMAIASFALGCALSANRVWNLIVEHLIVANAAMATVKCHVNSYLKRIITLALMYWSEEPLKVEKDTNFPPVNDSKTNSVCDECQSDISSNLMMNEPRREVLPISYGTNWTPKPNFSGYKEPQRKVSMKSLYTIGAVNDIQDSDELSPRQMRYKRGCHTVIPNNLSDQSSGC
ncbi:uncharacterized protein LOC108627415 [Ceratina calcarata]|uniref:Uncharacterized protein LOC108627415 n=1 Tax=Ceratina calcarata TaxID=156304 RepID=A0AAJ7J3W9_9HYME|nr:uncharacterized protein LOC108627415 [Ceratina calcarata]